MKKILFLLLVPSLSLAGGPKYRQKDAKLQDEIANFYHDIANPVIQSGTAESLKILGTTTNDNAGEGYIGQVMSTSTAGNFINCPANATWGTAISTTATAGDWTCDGHIQWTTNGATIAGNYYMAINTTGGTSAGTTPDSQVAVLRSTTDDSSMSLSGVRIKLASAGTIYLQNFCQYSVATPKLYASLYCRRAR